MSISITWLDPDRARLFRVSEERMERSTIDTIGTGSEGTAHTSLPPELGRWSALVRALRSANRILLIGPVGPKEDFAGVLARYEPELAKRVVGCESVDRYSDAAMAEYAWRHLRRPA